MKERQKKTEQLQNTLKCFLIIIFILLASEAFAGYDKLTRGQ